MYQQADKLHTEHLLSQGSRAAFCNVTASPATGREHYIIRVDLCQIQRRRGQPLSHKSSVLAAGEIVCFARLTFTRERGIIRALNLIPLKTVKERVTRKDRHSELRRVGTGRGMVGRRWFRSRAPSALALGCDGPARYSGRGLMELREARRCEPRANQGGNTVI